LSEIKTREILLVLKQIDRPLFESLFTLPRRKKKDLEDFMSKNFVVNVPLETFSKMTGRSLSTFKRDFKRVSADATSRWLKKKRLERAYYLIKEKTRRLRMFISKSVLKTFPIFPRPSKRLSVRIRRP